MVRRLHRTLLLAGGLAALLQPTSASAQAMSYEAAQGVPSADAACGLNGCSPRSLTYGYYRENWRRWPEEPAAPTIANSLTPYAKPPENSLPSPKAEVPDSRDEATPNQRHRGAQPSIGSSPSPAAEAQPAPSGATRADSPTRMRLESPSTPATGSSTLPTPAPAKTPPAADDQLPSLPDADSADEPFFPSPSDAETTPVPEAEPPEAELPEADLPEADSPEDSSDDLFKDLPDLGQVNPNRLRRYQNDRTSQYRRADESQAASRNRTRREPIAQEMPEPKSTTRKAARSAHGREVQPVSYQESKAARKNPLRSNKVSAKPAVQRKADSARRSAPRREVTPVEFLEDESDEDLMVHEEEYEVEEAVNSRSKRPSMERSSLKPSGNSSNAAFRETDIE